MSDALRILVPATIQGHEATCACGCAFFAQGADDRCPDCNGLPTSLGPRVARRVEDAAIVQLEVETAPATST